MHRVSHPCAHGFVPLPPHFWEASLLFTVDRTLHTEHSQPRPAAALTMVCPPASGSMPTCRGLVRRFRPSMPLSLFARLAASALHRAASESLYGKLSWLLASCVAVPTHLALH